MLAVKKIIYLAGSGHDAIYKSTDGGKSWRTVLDLQPHNKLTGIKGFGLQKIAFKDENTGIAVGQFGKILYTYDGGKSWIYESNLHDSVKNHIPPTMIVNYAGDTPLIATFTGHFFRMIEDTYAPKPNDTLSISGRVWEGDKGQPGIPVAIGYRVTMTDKDGYYHFGQLSPGLYSVRVLNKYYDDSHPNLKQYYYKPFIYHPENHEIELKEDTTGVDFNAEVNMVTYNLSVRLYTDGEPFTVYSHVWANEMKASKASDNLYSFPHVEEGNYSITAALYGYIFTPDTLEIYLNQDTTVSIEVSVDTHIEEATEPELYSLKIENGILHFDELPGVPQMQLTISDLSGRELLNEPMKQEHNINFLSPGVYIITLRKQGELVRSYKILISH